VVKERISIVISNLFVRITMEKDRFTNLCGLDKAEILNKYFASMFTQDPGSYSTQFGSYPGLPSFEVSL